MLGFYRHPVVLVAGFWVWHLAFKMVALTVISHFFRSDHFRLHDVAEAWGNNLLMILGLSTGTFLFALSKMAPLTGRVKEDLWDRAGLRDFWAPGLFQGAILATAWVGILLVFGVYDFVGIFLHPEENILVIVSLLIRTLTLFLLVHGTEYLFRERVLGALLGGARPAAAWLPVLLAAILSTFTFGFQMDLHPIHDLGSYLTLFASGIALGLRRLKTGTYMGGSGFWFGFLLLIHPVFGFSVFHNETNGILLVKYRAVFSETGTFQFLTGGDRGPVAAFLVAVLLGLDALRHIKKHDRIGDRR
jgi:hypothetical protein